MRVEYTKLMKENETGEDFDKRVVDFVVKQYEFSDRSIVNNSLKNALSFGYSIAVEGTKVIGLQTNYDRSKIYIGQ